MQITNNYFGLHDDAFTKNGHRLRTSITESAVEKYICPFYDLCRGKTQFKSKITNYVIMAHELKLSIKNNELDLNEMFIKEFLKSVLHTEVNYNCVNIL